VSEKEKYVGKCTGIKVMPAKNMSKGFTFGFLVRAKHLLVRIRQIPVLP
jgi:hypothetical protein